jgi:dipeptidase D
LKEAVANYEARLASVEGGSLRNAIPREASAIITVPAEGVDDIMDLVAECEDLFVAEYDGVEDNIRLTAEEVACPATELPEDVQDFLIHAVTACPHGVYRVIPEMPDVVETSNNLAMLTTTDDCVTVMCLTRSSVESRKEELQEIIHSVFAMAGAEVEFSGSYPGWKPNLKSHILDVMKHTYQTNYGVEPRVIIIHAGLECGIIGRNYPGMDMISFGPTIKYPHSPDERVNIASVAKFYDFLLATLKAL